MRKLSCILALLMLAACLLGCDESWQIVGTNEAERQSSGHTADTLPVSDLPQPLPPETMPVQTTVDPGVSTVPAAQESGTLYRGDLLWYGVADVLSNTVKSVEGDGKVRFDRTDKLVDGEKYAFQIQYSLIDYDEDGERVVTKSFYDFTDSDEDLAFYNAEVEYFESLGIEVLKDHRCANSTPGQTNGNVPALAVAMDKEQCAKLIPRLKNEFYSICHAVYYSVAPLETPDRCVYHKSELEWEWDTHLYRSDLLWVRTLGFDFKDPSRGEKSESVNYFPVVFSPSDRMALEIRIFLFDSEADELKADPERVIQKYRDYLESLGIEIWVDCLPGRLGANGIIFYASVTVQQMESITVFDEAACLLVALSYEEFITEKFPELAG